MHQTHKIKVINNNKFEIRDMYDGIAVHFKPCEGDVKKGVTMEPDAAKHIFGVDFPADAEICASDEFRDQIFEFLLRRWGWNSISSDKLDENRKKFAKFEFKPVIFHITEVITGGESEEPPPPREQKPVHRNPVSPVSKFKQRVDEVAADEAEVG